MIISCRVVLFWPFFLYLRLVQLCHYILWYNSFIFILEFRTFIALNNPGILNNDFIGTVVIMHMNIQCKSHNAVSQVTDKAYGLLVFYTALLKLTLGLVSSIPKPGLNTFIQVALRHVQPYLKNDWVRVLVLLFWMCAKSYQFGQFAHMYNVVLI